MSAKWILTGSIVFCLAQTVWVSEGFGESPGHGSGHGGNQQAWRVPDFANRHAMSYGSPDQGFYGSGGYSYRGGHAGAGGSGRFQGSRDGSSNSGGGWFQRPYPYHLDYYKMRYGGSYEPYFGNLYGPPIYAFPTSGYYGGVYYQ